MSLEDLRKMGLLRDEAEWGHRMPRSAVSAPSALGAAMLGVGGCAAMVLGDGGTITWLGLVACFAGLFSFIAASLRGVKRGR